MKTYTQNKIILGLLFGIVAAESVETEADSERYVMAQHPYGGGYKEDMMDEDFYKNTWRYTSNTQYHHLNNETAYENDTPSDYYVEPAAGYGLLAQKMQRQQHRHKTLKKHHPRGVFNQHHHQHLSQQREGDWEIKNVTLKLDPTMPIVFGPPTPEGEAAGAAIPVNADCGPIDKDLLPPKEILANETTWYDNKILKFSGDINWYKNSTPSGYDAEVDYDKKDTFKSTKEEKKKDQIEINKEAKKLAKKSVHKNVDMEEIEKVEKREDKKVNLERECNVTALAQAQGVSIAEALAEVQQEERMQQPQQYGHSYLSQWNNRELGIPAVQTTLTQRENPSWNPYHKQEPNAYDLYLKNQAFPNMYGTLAQGHGQAHHQGPNQHFVLEKEGEWHSDLEQYAQMEAIPRKEMARFAQTPHNLHHTPQSVAQQKYRIETHSKILPYVIRDHSWNFGNHDNTNFEKYKSDAPHAYDADVGYVLPNPTNSPTEVPEPLEPCTTAEEVEWANEKAAAKTAGLPKPEEWCKSAVEDAEDPVVDTSADDSEREIAAAAANGTAPLPTDPVATLDAPPGAEATAHKKATAKAPKSGVKAASNQQSATAPKKEVTVVKKNSASDSPKAKAQAAQAKKAETLQKKAPEAPKKKAEEAPKKKVQEILKTMPKEAEPKEKVQDLPKETPKETPKADAPKASETAKPVEIVKEQEVTAPADAKQDAQPAKQEAVAKPAEKKEDSKQASNDTIKPADKKEEAPASANASKPAAKVETEKKATNVNSTAATPLKTEQPKKTEPAPVNGVKLNKAEFAPKTHEAAKPTDHKNEIMKKDKDGKIQSQAETTANATSNTTASANSTQPATAAEKTKA